MKSDTSPFEVLGLQPGADRDAVEAAYRMLIKRFHPDRPGGDTQRAAEINFAYSEIARSRRPEMPPLVSRPDLSEAIRRRRAEQLRAARVKPKRQRRWALLLLMALAGAGFIYRTEIGNVVQDCIDEAMGIGSANLDGLMTLSPERGRDAAIDPAIIASAVGDARLFFGDKERALEASNACYREYRARQTFGWLDRCLAFDQAVAMLERPDLSGSGDFGANALTARQLAAARLMIDNYDEIDARLDRVRGDVSRIIYPIPA